MQGSWTDTFKLVLRSGLRVGRAIVFFTVLGTFLSWVLLSFLAGDLAALCGDESAGLIGSLTGCEPSLAITLLFLIGFPVAFFFAGQAYGVQQALYGIYSENRQSISVYVTNTMLSEMEKQNISFEQLAQNPQQLSHVQSYLSRLDGMPRFVRWVVRLFLKRVPYYEVVEAAVQQQRATGGGREAFVQQVAGVIDQRLAEAVPEPSKLPIWLALIALVGAYLAVEFGLG